jgi:phage/plasmid-associated DNA primase
MENNNDLHTLYKLSNYKVTEDPKGSNVWFKYVDNQKVPAKFDDLDIDTVADLIKKDRGYHMRIEPMRPCILYFDLDGWEGTIQEFITDVNLFYYARYKSSLGLNMDIISYSQAEDDPKSYHISFPHINATPDWIKKNIIIPMLEIFGDKYNNILDTSVYTAKWWKLPNQRVWKNDKNNRENPNEIHRLPQKIISGEIEDFIITHIPENSICIITEEINNIIPEKPKKNNFKPITPPPTPNNQRQEKNIFALIDCLKPATIDNYSNWIKLAYIFRNEYNDEGYNFFDYASQRGTKYKGPADTKKYFDGCDNDKQTIQINSLYYMALQDNKEEAKKILALDSLYSYTKEYDDQNPEKFEVNETLICEIIADFYKERFICQKGILYCFNGKYWIPYTIKNLSKENAYVLFNFLVQEFLNLVSDIYSFITDVGKYKNVIKKFKRFVCSNANRIKISQSLPMKVENNSVLFDNFPDYLPFNNIIYDLKNKKFIEPKPEYYISKFLDYDWRKPTVMEKATVKRILSNIMPDNDNYDSWVHFLARCLDGHSLEKFIIMTGAGGNGKGLINDLMAVCLRQFAYNYNPSILTDIRKAGAPEPVLAQMSDGARFIYGREPAPNKPIQNSMLKEITGGGKFNARQLYSNVTQGKITGKIILEANELPNLAENTGGNDIGRRLVVYKYKAIFSKDKYIVDNSPIATCAPDPLYKTESWQEQHKFALLEILFEKYSQTDLIITKEMKEETKKYLDKNNIVVDWFNRIYTLNPKIQIKDIREFIISGITNKDPKNYNSFFNHGSFDGLLKCCDLYNDFINSEEYNVADITIAKNDFYKCLRIKYVYHFIPEYKFKYSCDNNGVEMINEKNKKIYKEKLLTNVLFNFVKIQDTENDEN